MNSITTALYLMLSELGIDFESKFDRRDIQRKTYLLQALGVDFGFRYKMGYGKPTYTGLMYRIYDIEDNLNDLKKDFFIKKSLNEKGKKIIEKGKNIINKAEEFNINNEDFMEAIVLMHFLKKEVFYDGDKNQIIKEFKEFKPELKNNKEIIKELWSIIEEL